ncbi:hypothetical protein ACIBKZ_18300 [Streptomyces sp. NPDC050421]|uniref:hypothetical protein n=1 Tax=unclassified Streptomyces TaxID=2593676 RepID=UPI003788E208
MLTIHAAALLLPGGGRAPVPDGAVAVQDAVIAAFGPYGDVAAAHPAARVRRWPGVLTPGLLQRDAVRLLEESYFPDPREADTLGTEPLTGAALDALGPVWSSGAGEGAASGAVGSKAEEGVDAERRRLTTTPEATVPDAVTPRGNSRQDLGPDGTRRAGSVRRGLHRMLRHGTTAATAAPTTPPALITAMRRSGLLVTVAPAHSGGTARLDPLAGAGAVEGAMAAPLTVGGRADLAAFDVPDEDALLAAGGASCLATVAAGRLVYRGR